MTLAGYTGAAAAVPVALRVTAAKPPVAPKALRRVTGGYTGGYTGAHECTVVQRAAQLGLRRLSNNQKADPAASDAKKTIADIVAQINDLPASPEDLTAHLNTITEHIPQFNAVIESILECAKNPDLSNQNDLLDKIRTSLNELCTIINKNEGSELKPNTFSDLNSLLAELERLETQLNKTIAEKRQLADNPEENKTATDSGNSAINAFKIKAYGRAGIYCIIALAFIGFLAKTLFNERCQRVRVAAGDEVPARDEVPAAVIGRVRVAAGDEVPARDEVPA